MHTDNLKPMTEEEIRKIINDTFDENIMNNLDSSIIFKYIEGLEKENQELKKQLESCYCNRTDCSARIKDSKKYDSLVQRIENQQNEFIDWLESESKELIRDAGYHQRICLDILEKYKEIIGGNNE